jgi:hypothetical protein
MVPVWIDGALRKATAIVPDFRYDDLSEFLYDLSTPNPAFLKGEQAVPLLQRNPLLFWRSLFLLSVLVNIVSVYFLVH